LCVAVINCAEARQRTHRHTIGSVLDANGNTALSVVRSSKTGARASVLRRYAAAFQGYVDELEANGAIIRFMGGIRPGRCASRSLHPCGMALDICQMARGRVDRRCRLPAASGLPGSPDDTIFSRADSGVIATTDTFKRRSRRQLVVCRMSPRPVDVAIRRNGNGRCAMLYWPVHQSRSGGVTCANARTFEWPSRRGQWGCGYDHDWMIHDLNFCSRRKHG
jgi:hypothetical protein